MTIYVCPECGKILAIKPGQITTANVKTCCSSLMQVRDVLEIWSNGPDDPSPNTTWYVLRKYQDVDLEMWESYTVQAGKPGGEIAGCYAWAIRDIAQKQ